MTAAPAAFSVIIPTRDRPALVERAIASVRMQRGAQFELIIVDDGTPAPQAGEVAALVSGQHGNERLIRLAERAQGHGQSYAMNEGARAAHQPYLCFLDDDDEWTDPGYLALAASIIASQPVRPDIIYFQQRAQRMDGSVPAGPIWLEGLACGWPAESAVLPGGARRVTAAMLLQTDNHCHLNTTVIRRDFFEQIGGLNEGLRYENDRDFYLRGMDRAERIIYAPSVVSLHHVPDTAARNNMSTLYSQREKWLYQSDLFARNALMARHVAVRRLCRKHYGYVMKKLAQSLAAERRYKDAYYHAKLGLASDPGLAWAGMTAYLAARAVLAPGRQ